MRQQQIAKRRRFELGLTLIEIMVVVIIMTMVTGVVGVMVFNRFNEAQKKVAFTQLTEIANALDLYRLSVGSYPAVGEGLPALVTPKNGEKAFLKSVPKDPWHNDFVYMFPGVHNPQGFDLSSNGPDGIAGSEDDITNWEKTSSQN